MLSGVKLLDFAGADYVIAAGAIVAAVAFAVWGLIARAAPARLAPRRPA